MDGKVDLFFRCAPKGNIRDGIARACLERWIDDPLVTVRLIRMKGLALRRLTTSAEVYLDEDNFHFTSRRYADEHATTEPYAMVDDDEMPLGADWVQRAVGLWNLHNSGHEYAMLCGRSALTCEDMTRHHPRLRDSANEVEENPYWWGCPYLSYKGAVPYGELKGPAEKQDVAVEEWARRNGRKQGLMMGVFYNHFGLGLSQVQPALYGRF